MTKHDALLSNILRATHLTGMGRLAEATAFLQRVLQGEPMPDSAKLLAGQGVETVDSVSEALATSPSGGFCAGANRQSADGMDLRLMPEGLRNLLDQVSRGGFPQPRGGLAYPSPAEAPVIPNGAQFLTATFSNEAGSRPYKLFVPSGYRGQAVPLIVMLHGCTQSPDDFAVGTGMNLAAEDHTCLIAYPAQTAAANRSKCWNWFSADNQQRGKGEPSLIAGITRQVMRDYVVDPQRVYVAGLSAGGAAAAIMGTTYPDLYAAIGVHSGLACGSASDMPSAFVAMRGGNGGVHRVGTTDSGNGRTILSAIVFHGDRDSTVHPRNGDQVIAQVMTATSLDTKVEHGQVPGGHAYSRTVYADTKGDALLELWLIHDAGHAWAGGNPAGSYTDPRGPDATREMLRFFLEHPHRVAAKSV